MEVSYFALILLFAQLFFPPGLPYGPAGKPAEQPVGKVLYTWVAPSLNVREKPDVKARTVASIPRGTAMKTIAADEKRYPSKN